MKNAKTGTWVGGAVVVCLLMVVAAWFLAISPVLTQASDLKDQTQQTRDSNVALQAEVTQLAADFANLDQYKAQLAAYRVQIPTEPEFAEFLRQLAATAETHGVTITEVTTQAAQVVTLSDDGTPAGSVSTEAQPTPSPSASPSSDGSGDSGSTDLTDVVAAMVPDGFTAIPYTIKVVGTYDATLAFLHDVQLTQPRLFLVASLQGQAQTQSDATDGRPATEPGDQELQISGFTYVLPATTVADEEEAPAATLPGAVPGKNPLVPVAGE